MSILLLRRPAQILACATAVLASGCVMVPYGSQGGYGAYGGSQAYGDVVTVAPPPPQQEVIGVAPALGYLWIGGYWGWGGGRHHWVPGYWSAPRPGHTWVPHGWVRSGNGWRLNQGHWQRH
ncbi:MAG: YXWGXW repeat-containing protein [Ideonella sp.]|nr:YXWGXW repeat-containing protein [Ideonella sp.]MBL0147351.1 YXWGXW repeat-containing protein [Ideonella sp.]